VCRTVPCEPASTTINQALSWLDAVLDRLTQTTAETDLRTFLDTYLKSDLPGKESRAKGAGIVLRIWSTMPPERVPLRERAVAMLPRISGQERLWLHWGMAALAYPFFRDTAEVVGRLLALQDDFTTAQVQSRMLTSWGDRATNREAVQKLITTLVDWEVLRSTKTKGHFLLARRMTASIPDLQLWLLEALLGASAADEIEAQQLLRLPESFPFTLSIGIADLRRYEGFNIHRQGLDMDMVALRKVKLEPLSKPTKKPKKEEPLTPDQASLFDIPAEEIAQRDGKPDAARRQLDAEVPLEIPADKPGETGTSITPPPATLPRCFHGSVTLDTARVGRDAAKIAKDGGRPTLKSKLLFQDYRFGLAGATKKVNTITVGKDEETPKEYSGFIVGVGRLVANEICITGSGYSRRHAAIVNYLDDVWIHDLDSATGVTVSGQRIDGKVFLDGVSEVQFGRYKVMISPKRGLLV
jgi:hypothetical protein